MNEDLIRYRLDRAQEAVDDAGYLLADNRLRAAVNRLYYSMFYAVVALLETEGYKSSKHSGVRSLFNQHFVKTGVVSREAADFYGLLFKNRHKGDYVDYSEFSEEKVKEYQEKCVLYVAEIRKIVLKRVGSET